MGRYERSDALQLRAHLVGVLATARALDARLAAPVSGATDAVRRETIACIDALADVLDVIAEDWAPADDERDDPSGMRPLAPPSEAPIADVAFVSTLSLRARRAGLEDAAAPAAAIVSRCGSAARQVARAASAVDAAIASALGVPQVVLLDRELETALEIRRHYAALHAVVRAERAELDATAALRRIGNAIATLRGKEAHAHLRLADRVEIAALHARIVEWQRGPRDALAGRRLVEDAVVFVEVLQEVNHRAELVEHDARLGTPRIDAPADDHATSLPA